MSSPWIQERMSLVRAALGSEPFDLLLTNVQVMNVYSGKVIPGRVGVRCGRIATLTAPLEADTLSSVDCGGRFMLPGFIDTHVHIDTTLLTAEGMAQLVVPHGTTALMADPMEIANVAGYRGLKALFDHTRALPLHVYLAVPSRVPTAPGLETTGGELGLEEVRRLLRWADSASLGELDPSKVLGLREEYFAKLEAAHTLGKTTNGHAAGLDQFRLNAYACAGLMDDHECVTFDEALKRVELGLAVLVREGSTERNLEALVRGVLQHRPETRHWMFCTDDKHPNELQEEGHIDYMVNKAIALGLDPLTAVQMASFNGAVHYHLDHEIGSLAPGRRADFILSPSLDHVKVEEVYFGGKCVAQDGRLLEMPRAARYPAWLRRTVHLVRGLKAQDYALAAGGKQARVRVIEILPDQIVNQAGEAMLEVREDALQADAGRDLLKLAVVERYGKNGGIGVTFVKGFGLQRGALSSTVSHDHHNLVIVGADDESMATCARAALEMQGGFVVACGSQVLARLPLPLAGLQTDRPPQEVIDALECANAAAHSLGCRLPAPFMSLSFISLPTVPELGLTDRGLVDVLNHRLISPFLD